MSPRGALLCCAVSLAAASRIRAPGHATNTFSGYHSHKLHAPNAASPGNATHHTHAAQNLTDVQKAAKLQDGLRSTQRVQALFAGRRGSLGARATGAAKFAEGALTEELSSKDSAIRAVIGEMVNSTEKVAAEMEGKSKDQQKKIMQSLEAELDSKAVVLRNVTNDATNHSANIEDLLNIAKQSKPTSDKFTDHTYQTMYGTFLMPLRNLAHVKLLEIGMGCNMKYGPGASVKLWRIILPQAEMWEAEYNKKCVDKMRSSGTLPKDLNVLVGDQANPETLQRWIQESGGMFDVVIDDGGHTNKQIKNSFDYLWPHVKPGGVYFIEDLQVGRNRAFDDTHGTAVMSDIIQAWVEQLIISAPRFGSPKKGLVSKNPLPKAVEAIFCQHEACVLTKQSRDYPGKEWK